MTHRMLITGVSGMLGNNLAHYFKDKYEILGLYNLNQVQINNIHTEKCDLTDPSSTKSVINDFKPKVIIHCASLTDVDECDKNKEKAKSLNVDSTRNIAEQVSDTPINLIYISSDSVYDGTKGNFSEDDAVNPLNYYGVTKFLGELETSKHRQSLILRTNLFGWNIQNKKGLGEWIIKRLLEKKRINGFQDALFSTIYTMEFARVVDIAIRKNLTGTFNCGAADFCSKYEFAAKIAGCFGFDKSLVSPILLEESSLTAKRGKNLSLNVKKLQTSLNYRLPKIDSSVEIFYRDYTCLLNEEIKSTPSVFPPRSNFIQYGSQSIDSNDIQSVIGVIKSGRVTQGPKVKEFEKALAGFCKAKHAVAVNSGTSALHVSCMAAGIGPGDEVITSPITFVASANCVAYCGGTPVFADIDPETYTIAPAELEKKISKRTKALIPVHFAGQSCGMDAIQQIKKDAEKKYGHKIYIIEDACHALGSLYKDKKVGSCAFSDMTVMSFHPVKHITTGEGGVVFTNDENLYKRLCRFRSHGITSDPEDFINKDIAYPSHSSQSTNHNSPNPWYYEQQELGFNYRITDIQCALGLSQLKKLGMFRKRRREIVNMYNEAFDDFKYVQTPFESAECDSNFHLYVLLFEFGKIGIDRAQLMLELKKKGIQTQVHYIPVHLHPYFRRSFGIKEGACPNAEQYYQKCLSIPLYPAMTDLDIKKVIHEIKNIIK